MDAKRAMNEQNGNAMTNQNTCERNWMHTIWVWGIKQATRTGIKVLKDQLVVVLYMIWGHQEK